MFMVVNVGLGFYTAFCHKMAFKDLTDFKSQYALHKNMQLLTEAVTAV
jgi:hypothetical protein